MFVTYDASVTDTPVVVTYDTCALNIIQMTCVRCSLCRPMGTTVTETLITDNVCSLRVVQMTCSLQMMQAYVNNRNGHADYLCYM